MADTTGVIPKHVKFVEELLVDSNQTQAAIRAGYSPRCARSTASAILTNPNTSRYLAERRAELAEKFEITEDRIMREYTRLAFLDIGELYDESGDILPIKDMPEDSRRALTEVTSETRTLGRGDDAEPVVVTKIKAADKRAALDSLSKILGMVKYRHEHSGAGGGPIDVRRVSEIDRDKLMEIAANGNNTNV